MTYADFDIEVPQGRTTGQVYTKCPKCSQDRKKKHVKCLGVNLDLGIWHCNHCDWKGTVNQKKYERPKWENKTDLPESIVEWFLKRNITQAVLNEMKISHGVIWMPQCEAEKKVMCFNYFRNGELINIKYRDSAKNFRMHKDAELILYNLDGISGQKEIFITEGECDALVMIQAGFKSTCSVPNGANQKNNNLEYLDNCWQSFENAEKVYLMTDNDAPGIKLADEIARRIGVERCYRVNMEPFKDVNDAVNAGERITREWIDERATPFPLVGVYNADDFWSDLLEIRKHGFPKGWKPRGELGNKIQIHPGYQTVITGVPGHGKSEFLDQMLLELCFDHDLRGIYFSPENFPTTIHLIKIVEKLSGRKFWDLTISEINDFKAWITERIHWVHPEDNLSLSNVLNHVRKAVLRYGINWYVIDPWNKLDHQYTGAETQYISQALDELDLFNKKNNVHGFLIAHPTKMSKDESGNYHVPNLYSISGSAHFFNKTAIGMTVYKSGPGMTEVHVQKVKFKYWGEQGMVTYYWDQDNGRYYGASPDKTNWLKKPENNLHLIDYTEPSTPFQDVPF
jgi:twinkle protein